MAQFKYSILISFVTNPVNRQVAAPHAGGWSEQFWRNNTIYTAEGLRQVATLRAAMLPVQCSVIGIRVQTYNIVGAKLAPGGASVTQLGSPGLASYTLNNPQSALQLRLVAQGAINVGRYTLRGLPDEVMVNGEYNPTGGFAGALDAYKNFLKEANVGFIGRLLSNPAIDVMGSDGTSLIVSSAAGLVVGDMMTFIKVKNGANKSISGTYQIAALPGANKITFVGGFGSDAVPGGKVRKAGIAFFQTSDVTTGRASVRKVGRPFGGYVGRRSRRRVA